MLIITAHSQEEKRPEVYLGLPFRLLCLYFCLLSLQLGLCHPAPAQPGLQGVAPVWQTADFQVFWNPVTSALRIERKQPPPQLPQVLLQTPAGQTWLQAQHNLLAAREQRGSFTFHPTVRQHCQTLRADRSWNESGSWYLQGGWREQDCNQHWLLQISAAEAQQLALTLKLSPGPLQHLRRQ